MPDVVIVGGGPGGYVAALRAAQLGAQVVLVEKDRVGGTCLRRGCIPTKALLTSAEVFATCRKATEFGVQVENLKADLPQMMARKDKVVEQLTRGVEYLLNQTKVRLVKGTGRLAGPRRVLVQKEDHSQEEMEARAVIIATGSEPARLPGLEADGQRILDSTQVLELRELPASILIVGAGAIGVEFACFFADLGTTVTLVEMLPQVLPTEDEEMAGLLERELKRKGVKVHTGSKVGQITRGDDGLVVELSTGQAIATDKVLVSVGRSLNSQGVGLEATGVRTERGRIVVNERMETNQPGVYAIGDVTGGILLAHVASAEGLVAAENCTGHALEMDYRVVPNCIYSSPEVASVGLSEKAAREGGYEVQTAKFPWRASGRALAMGHREGLVKLVANAKNDRLLGAQILGAHASDLIGELALALSLEATVGELEEVIRAHPSLVETIGEAAHLLHGRPIHI